MSFGVIVNEITSPVPSGAATDTGQCFVTGMTATVPATQPVPCNSINDFVAAFGARTGASVAVYDWLDVAFREGLITAQVAGYAAIGGYTGILASGGAFDGKNQGPGQVVVVGETNAPAVYSAIQAHVDGHNRVGLLDGNTGDLLTQWTQHGTDAQALTSLENLGVFGSWCNAPAPPGVVAGSARAVPASAVVAGMISRVDQLGNPNVAAGGRDFPCQYVTGFQYDPVVADRTTLFGKGVNMMQNVYGVLENYGFQTPEAQSTSSPFWQLNCSRTRMWMKAQALQIGEKYYMKTIDGQGQLAGQLGADLELMCANLYAAGGLYGDTAPDAYDVNVSQTINTTASAAAGTLNAQVQAKLSQYAKAVVINLVSIPIAGVVS